MALDPHIPACEVTCRLRWAVLCCEMAYAILEEVLWISVAFPPSCPPDPDPAEPGTAPCFSPWTSLGRRARRQWQLPGWPESQGEGQEEGGCLLVLVPGAHLGLVGTRRHPQGLGGTSTEITQEPATPRGLKWHLEALPESGDRAEGKQFCNAIRGARLPSLGHEHPWRMRSLQEIESEIPGKLFLAPSPIPPSGIL